MSVWADFAAGGSAPPPGTPDLQIRAVEAGYMVLPDGMFTPDAVCPTYPQAHRYCMNEYGLTSTMMLAVHAEYTAHCAAQQPEGLVHTATRLAAEVVGAPGGARGQPNRFRKPGV